MGDPDTQVSDHHVSTRGGALFARAWRPDGAAHDAAILLFHDSLGSVELWRDFPLRLAQAANRQVIAYDRLGFGLSSASPHRPTLDFMRDEARHAVPAICAALGLARIVALGHSVGGAMAVATGAALPELCEAVLTESAQAFVEDRTIAGIKTAKCAFASPEQVARLHRYHGAKAQWVLDAWIDTWLSADFAGWVLDADLRALRCPVLAMHGDRDEYGSLVHPERIASLAGGGGELAIIADCGHMPHREHTEEVLAIVVKFLGRPATRKSGETRS